MAIVCIVLALLALAIEAGCRRGKGGKAATGDRKAAERTTGG